MGACLSAQDYSFRTDLGAQPHDVPTDLNAQAYYFPTVFNVQAYCFPTDFKRPGLRLSYRCKRPDIFVLRCVWLTSGLPPAGWGAVRATLQKYCIYHRFRVPDFATPTRNANF